MTKDNPRPCPCGSYPVFDSAPMWRDEYGDSAGFEIGTQLYCLTCGRESELCLTVDEAVAEWNSTRDSLQPKR